MKKVLLSLLLLAIPVGSSAGARPCAVFATADRLNIPGVSIAIVSRDGINTLSSGVLQDESEAQVEEHTVFQAGSLGKPLFAYGVMLLVQDGKLDLDAPLSTYNRENLTFGPPLDTLTTRQLLSHSAGLPPWFRGKDPYLLHDPGTRWAYSGQGYVILQALVEDIVGISAERWMQESVLQPLRMYSSSYVSPDQTQTGFVTAHDRDGEPMPAQHWDRANVASSLHTTSNDYAKFMNVLLKTGAGPLGAAYVDEMLTPQVIFDESRALSWSLGWAVQTGSEQWFFHWASNPGYKALAVFRPESEDAIVYLSNGDNGLELADEILLQETGEAPEFLNFYMLHPDD